MQRPGWGLVFFQLGLAVGCGTEEGGYELGSYVGNPIVAENQRVGTASWLVDKPAPNGEIEGYASTVSAFPGERVSVQVSATVEGPAHWELYRLGDYGGLGGRLVSKGAIARAAPQAPCPVSSRTGLIECTWNPTFSIVVDPDWVTGQYLFKLIRSDGFESYVPLIVRESSPRAPIVYQSNVTTWQAYNAWGGASLYENTLPASDHFAGSHAYQVSFDRPYEYARPLSENHAELQFGAGQMFLAEIWMIRWLERRGYDLAYVTNVDVDAMPSVLDGRKLFLDVGHDEYWSVVERQAIEGARDQGLSLAFFSANDAYWRIRFEASSSGTPRRIVTCYKDGRLDPVRNRPDTTTLWSVGPDKDPEDELIGEAYGLSTNMDAFPLVVRDPTNWIYRGAGVGAGDTLAHVVGYEWDTASPHTDEPADTQTAARSPAIGAFGEADTAEVTVYRTRPSSFVFSAGTIEWAWGLGKPGYRDSRIEKITANVLGEARQIPATAAEIEATAEVEDIGDAGAVTLVAGAGTPGHTDGSAATATFDTPAGVAEDGGGTIYVTEARNHDIRKVAPDGTVSTIAGCGPNGATRGGFADGKGTKACFDAPTGIAIGQNGTVYVCDTVNRRIRAVTPAGVVTTYAGDGTNDLLDGPRESARFQGPRGLAFGPDGALYVADYRSVRKIQNDRVTTLAPAVEPTSVAVAPDGTVYVLETGTGSIAVLDGGALRPIVNESGTLGDLGGPGAGARLRPVEGLALDGSWLVVSDTANYKLRRVSLASLGFPVTTFVGDGRFGADLGTGATTRVVNPRGLAVTAAGILVADSANHRILRVARSESR